MKTVDLTILGVACAAALGLGVALGIIIDSTARIEKRIEQIHTHTCRLEAKLDYPTTPDCPVAPEDDR